MQGETIIKSVNNRNINLLLSTFIIIILCCYLYAFWPTLSTMELIWRNSETYMHCYLILPISLWLVFRKKTVLRQQSLQPSLLPALLSIPISILWLMAYAVNVNFVSQFAVIIYLQLIIWSFIGHSVAKAIWFPLSFLIFLVPFGESINPLLQQITADFVVYMLHLINFPVFRDGLYIHTATTTFEVAVACSGLNFLLTSLVLSCLFSYLNYKKWYKAVIFIALVLGFSIIANGIRAFLLVVIGEKTNLAYGFGADHYYYGWIVFFIVMFCSFWIGAKFADPETTSHSDAAEIHATNSPRSISFTVVLFTSLVLVTWSSKSMLEIDIPETPAAVLNIAGSVAIEKSSWGIQFFDGLTRDHWLLESNVELFQASYAHRQSKGDMLTWHNRLYDLNFWSISKSQIHGGFFDNHQQVTLSSPNGNRRILIYWYEVGSIKSSNRYVIKLAQLIDLMLGNKYQAKVKAILTPSEDIDLNKIIEKKSYLH